jgi:type II secretory pathway component PulM
MSAVENVDRRGPQKGSLLERLHDPTQLRMVLTATVLAVAYVGVYQPFNERISATRRSLSNARKRLALAHDVEQLRQQYRPVQERLARQSGSKEWEQYMLGCLRKFPLKLEAFQPLAPRELGPYKAVAMQIQLSGPFPELDRFLHWLESNEKLFRVDSVSIAPASGKDPSKRAMTIVVLGLLG